MNLPNTIASDTLVEVIARALHGEPKNSAKFYIDAAQAALTAITEAGYAVVPREPTEAMLEAGQLEAEGCTDDWTASAACLSGHVWSAMLAMHAVTHCNHDATNNGKAE